MQTEQEMRIEDERAIALAILAAMVEVRELEFDEVCELATSDGFSFV